MSKGTSRSRQIDPGTHDVNMVDGSNVTWVGQVFAEGTPGETIIEYWVLSDDFTSPDGELRLDVGRSAPTAQHTSLGAFFAEMRERSSEWSGTTYIKATCEYADSIPEL